MILLKFYLFETINALFPYLIRMLTNVINSFTIIYNLKLIFRM